MAALLQIGLVNAALATFLACLVALIARKVRNPALIHLLWIVVLAKLVSPPLIEIPIEVPYPVFAAAHPSVDDTPATAVAETAAIGDTACSVVTGKQDVAVSSAAGDPTRCQSAAAAPAEAEATSGAPKQGFARLYSTTSAAFVAGNAWLLRHLVAVLGWTWLGGAALWFLRQAFTTLRYSRRLALATPAPPALQQQADDLSRAMGLSCRPPVLIVRDVISPMLWGIGQNTRLLFPVDLLARLQPGARETLIAHELAHFRRRDHWVRAFELVVSGLFWWHPVVWWARREIEIAEEECCDAWVIEQFPETPRCYAEALLTTLDFLSGEGAILPPAAAGLGHVPFLKRRLTAIMRGAAPKALSGPAWLAVLVLAATSLPLHPGLTPAVARSNSAVTLAGAIDNVASEPSAIVAELGKLANEFPDPFRSPPEATEKTIEATSLVPEEKAWAVARSPGNRYMIMRRGRESRVSLFNAASGRTDKEIDLSEYHIVTVLFAPDGNTFATGGADSAVRLWASSTGEVLKTFWGHPGSVQAVAFLDNGKTLLSASRDGTMKLWDLEHGSELRTLTSRFSPLNSLAVSPDGRWLALGTGSWKRALESPQTMGGQVTILDLANFQEQAPFDCEQPVGALAFKFDRHNVLVLISGDWQGKLTFWDVAAHERLGCTLPQYKNDVAAAQFSPDTQAFALVEPANVIIPTPAEEPPATFPYSIFSGQSASLFRDAGNSAEATDAALLGPVFERGRIQPNGLSRMPVFERSQGQRPQAIGFSGEKSAASPDPAPRSKRAAPQTSAPRYPMPAPSEPGD